jgi:hypothetical protein
MDGWRWLYCGVGADIVNNLSTYNLTWWARDRSMKRAKTDGGWRRSGVRLSHLLSAHSLVILAVLQYCSLYFINLLLSYSLDLVASFLDCLKYCCTPNPFLTQSFNSALGRKYSLPGCSLCNSSSLLSTTGSPT